MLNGSDVATGTTRFNVSVNVTGVRPLPALVAHVHSRRCDHSPPGGGHYKYNSSLSDDAMVNNGSFTPNYGTNTLSLVISQNGRKSTQQPWLIDYDQAASVVIHDPLLIGSVNQRIACINLIPNLPNLPSDYSTTIEANFGLTKSYTMILVEYASATLGKRTIVTHSNLTSQVQVQDLVRALGGVE